VVEVSGFDYSACGGTHCRRTGEVGLIKILKQEDEPDAFELPATPITIRAVEQKKESELVPRLAPSTEQNPQAADPDKAAVPVSEKPRRTDSVDKIYTSRVAAGASWLSGLKDDRYTVRLMVITSGDAEKKLKSMLGEKNYREQADKFYILRRESNPGVQYVYYGEYPTMTAAAMPGILFRNFFADTSPTRCQSKGQCRGRSRKNRDSPRVGPDRGRSSDFFNDQAADRISGAERADDALIA